MGDETLGDFVKNGSLNGHIFESVVAVTGNAHMLYRVDSIEGDILNVFPIKYEGKKVVVEESSVGVLYRQHIDDRVHISL